jgi:hypothetical protein
MKKIFMKYLPTSHQMGYVFFFTALSCTAAQFGAYPLRECIWITGGSFVFWFVFAIIGKRV